MLEELKSYLKITWDEEDLLLTNLLNDAKEYLNELCGVELDYTNINNKSLVKDYVRYAYNNNLEWFEINFTSKLLRLQLKEGIKSYEEGKI